MKAWKIGMWAVFFSLSSFAQNFTGGFNFTIPYNDGTTVAFLPKFPAKTISSADRVTVNGAQFTVEGQPIRFWGVNITSAGAFPAQTTAPGIATHARKMGINLVRFHHLDNPWGGNEGSIFVSGQSTRTLNTTTLDRLDFLINELKKNNIYTNMNLNVSRTFKVSDGVANADSLVEYAKGVTIIDPQLIALQKEYATQLLGHVNPYTGMKLAEDPCLGMVEIINENSLYGMWKDNVLKTTKQGGWLLLRHAVRLDSLWNAFLITKYQTQTNLQTAWQAANAGVTERVADGGFEGASLNPNWVMEQNAGAAATAVQDAAQGQTGSKSAKVTVVTKGTETWHLQFKYTNFSVQKDSAYVIQFWAKANQNTTINASLSRDDSPYTWYGGQDIPVTTNWQLFKVTVTAPENNSGKGRLSFQVGKVNNGTTLWFDNVSLAEPVRTAFLSGETLTIKNIRRFDYSERATFTKQRVADLAQFYIQLQKGFMEDMRLFLKNTLGVQAPITGTNALVGIQEGMEHENMDYYDDHSYWDHPQFPGVPWDASNWLINNTPMVKNGSLAAITGALPGLPLYNKPHTVSEYNHGYPNRYRVEMVPAVAAYGAFHGMDGVMFFEYNSDVNSTWSLDKVGGYFSIHRDHSTMSLFPSCAWAFRNGLITEGTPTLVNYSESDVYRSFEKDNNGRWGKYVPYDLRLQLTHSLRTGTYHHPQGLNAQSLPAVSNTTFQTNTQQTILNTQTGILTTQTPRFVSLTGFLNAAPNTQVGPFRLTNANEFGAITWVSLNNKPLTESDSSLITIASQTQNTGMVWNGTNTSVNNNWGSNPTTVRALQTEARLSVQAEALRIHRLSPSGQITSTFDILPTAMNTFDITFLQSTDQTLWYAVQAVKKADLVLAITTPSGNGDVVNVYPNPAENTVTVDFTLNAPKPMTIEIINAAASMVFNAANTLGQAGPNSMKIDVKNLPNGTYFIRVGSMVKKFNISR
ncbi:MAG: carbohydrate binding domain-containing protein [Spirosomataceae bacterium]